MSNTQSLGEKLECLLKQKQSKSYYAKRLGISQHEVTKLLKEINERNKKSNSTVSIKGDPTKGTQEIDLKFSDKVETLEDLIEKANIDTDKWKIDKYIQNYWGNEKNPHWQVKIWLSPKLLSEQEQLLEILDSYESDYKPLAKSDIILNDSFGRPCMAQISLLDFHFDKLTVDNTPIKDREEEYLSVVNNLLYKCYRHAFLEEIVFIIGEDFFHSDTFNNTTTKGTPVDVSTTWDNAYERGFDLHVKVIQKLKNFCEKLKVILIQGNHDRTKSFYLAHALEVFFKPDQNISFQRHHSTTKFITYGNTFIGYHHGNCKVEELPMIFATSKNTCQPWGNSVYREIHVGDKHSYKETEIKGTNVRIKRLPSLSGDDKWHNDENFINHIKAGIALIYDKELGRVAEFEERIII